MKEETYIGIIENEKDTAEVLLSNYSEKFIYRPPDEKNPKYQKALEALSINEIRIEL